MRTLLESIEKINRQHRLLEAGDGIVLGLSGGPDSTALLLALLNLRRKYGLKLYAAHLNHGLSRQASAFERFSEKLARREKIPFFKKKISVRPLAAKKCQSLEEAGREARYEFFAEIARKTGAKF